MKGTFKRGAAHMVLGGAFAGAALLAGAAHAQAPADAPAPMDLPTAIQSGSPIFEVRPRYETVGQTGTNDSEALTVRTRLGWQTAKWNNIVGLIEFEDVRQLGAGDYDDGIAPVETANGKAFANIADPEVTELNRLQLTWTPTDTFTATLGRQRIILDDQRFVGTVAWRQDEQTFDALKLDADLGRFDITYAYLGHINRIFGEALDYESNSHLLNASYTIADPLKFTGFVYALDFQYDGAAAAAAARNASNITYGVRATGNMWAGRFKLAYAASFATQSEYGDNTNIYDADYIALEGAATLGPTTLRLGYESLEGEGANRRFQTPLATLHIFQGWADAFLATPNNGVEDWNGSVIINPRWRRDHLFNINLLARYHEYEAEKTGADLGSEINLSASANITRRTSFIVKWADYDGPGGTAPADRTKTWIGFEFKL